MAESLFKANPNLGRLFQAKSQRVVEKIWLAIQRWAQIWSRNSARVTPVETGQLRRSFFVVPIRNGLHFTIILANHMTYGKFTEFGTRYIAHGHVLAWKQGDPPVMMWPAKAKDLQQPGARASAKTHDRWSARLEKATTIGQGEQMPYVRPTGYELVPKIITDVQQIVQKGLAA